jgi:hypothetical protein
MKKLKLNLDALQVESFATDPDHQTGRGTVEGHISGRVLCGPVNPSAPFERSIILTCGTVDCNQPSFALCTEKESCYHGCIVSAGCPTRVVCPIDPNPRTQLIGVC